MVSAGLTLIFGMMGVLNFAHASFYMIGAYTAYSLEGYFGFGTSIILSTLFVSALGVAMERWILRRVHRFGHAHELLVTFGIAFIVAELIKSIFGNFPVNYAVPKSLEFPLFHIGSIEYPFYRVFMGGVALAMLAGLYLLLSRTRVGLIVRAAIYKPDMVSALGHNVQRVFMLVVGVGAGLAGLAGAVAGAFYSTNPNMALDLGVMVFVVVVVGGLGSLPGAFIASLINGLLVSFSVMLDFSLNDILPHIGLAGLVTTQSDLMSLKISSVAATLPFLLMLLVLLFKPAGLMGETDEQQ